MLSNNNPGSFKFLLFVVYSDAPYMKFQLNEYTTQLAVLNAIAFMPEYGKTGTATAITSVVSDMFTAETGDRPGVPNYLIIITGRYILQMELVPPPDMGKNSGMTQSYMHIL